jgi:tetratricopeptide (TPR) repeat protein
MISGLGLLPATPPSPPEAYAGYADERAERPASWNRFRGVARLIVRIVPFYTRASLGRRRNRMGALSRFFRRERPETQRAQTDEELARLLEEQTGDPAYIHRANWITAFGKRDFETALTELNLAIERGSNASLYLALRGMTHYEMGRYGEARSDVSASLAADPTQKEALDLETALRLAAEESRDRARQLAREGRQAEGIEELGKAIALEPDNAFNYFFRGLAYAQSRDFQPAIADLTKTLELDPAHPEAGEMLEAVQRMASAAGSS